jgi:hypothetical protein
VTRSLPLPVPYQISALEALEGLTGAGLAFRV